MNTIEQSSSSSSRSKKKIIKISHCAIPLNYYYQQHPILCSNYAVSHLPPKSSHQIHATIRPEFSVQNVPAQWPSTATISAIISPTTLVELIKRELRYYSLCWFPNNIGNVQYICYKYIHIRVHIEEAVRMGGGNTEPSLQVHVLTCRLCSGT